MNDVYKKVESIFFLSDILMTCTRVSVLECFESTFLRFLPQVKRMVGYNAHHSTIHYDLWSHSLSTVTALHSAKRGGTIDDPMLFLAAFLHDIGMPNCRAISDDPADNKVHYDGHHEQSAKIVEQEILPHLSAKHGMNLTEDAKRRLIYYVRYHDDKVGEHLDEHLKIASREEIINLLYLQIADAMAHEPPELYAFSSEVIERITICRDLIEQLNEMEGI